LLCKWWWALENDKGLWQDIVKIKYVKNSPICSILFRYNDSPVWSDLLKIRHIYLQGRELKINKGPWVSFWLDFWMDGTPLCQAYLVLFELATDKKCSVCEVKDNGWVINVKIRLQGMIRAQWYELVDRLNNISLNDVTIWKWTGSKKFTVKSVYEHDQGGFWSWLQKGVESKNV
jgi:hypothetical protein